MFNLIDYIKANLIVSARQDIIYTLVALSVFELGTGIIQNIITHGNTYVKNYFNNKDNTHTLTKQLTTKPRYQIKITRKYEHNTSDKWIRADAILDYVTNISNTTHIYIDNLNEYINTSEDIEIGDDIHFTLLQTRMNKDTVEFVEFIIWSDTKDVPTLRHYIEEIRKNYVIKTKNQLEHGLYFFDQVYQKSLQKHQNSISQELKFSVHPFKSNRYLHNVFHHQQEEFRNRITFFKHNKQWYDNRGIPYTFGALLYGEPGTGKTSTIKAVANELNRHIINISLSRIHTVKQLKSLFFDERLLIHDSSIELTNKEVRIPIHQRMYVIEDIDDLDDNIISRNYKANDLYTFENDIQTRNDDKNDFDNEQPTLSSILNVIDGVLETEGRVLFITTNYPERLDKALIRPGRMDIILEFTKCTHAMLRDIINCFYDVSLSINDIHDIPEYKWTPAEVLQHLFQHFNNMNKAIYELISLNPVTFNTNILDMVDHTQSNVDIETVETIDDHTQSNVDMVDLDDELVSLMLDHTNRPLYRIEGDEKENDDVYAQQLVADTSKEDVGPLSAYTNQLTMLSTNKEDVGPLSAYDNATIMPNSLYKYTFSGRSGKY